MLNFIPAQKHSLLFQLLSEVCDPEQIICGDNLNEYLHYNTEEVSLVLPIFDLNGQVIPKHFDFLVENKLHIHDLIQKKFNLCQLSLEPTPETIWVDYMSYHLLEHNFEGAKLKICHNLYEACKKATQNPKHGLICHQNFIEQLDLPVQKIYSTKQASIHICNASQPKNIKDQTHLILNFNPNRDVNINNLLHPFYNQNIEISHMHLRPHCNQLYLKLNTHFTQNKTRKAIYHYEQDLQHGHIEILGHNKL